MLLARALAPVKATVVDDDAFRLLAIPFGGPIPSKSSPLGVDLDGQWFDRNTDIKPDWFDLRLVDWHHGGDTVMARTVLGKATDLIEDDDGWWVTVWLKHGERRLDLIKRLAEKGAQLFGSSETGVGMGRMETGKGDSVPWRRDLPGRISAWPYVRQTLSTSPQNTYSVLRPLKATLDDYTAAGNPPTAAFFRDLTQYLDDLIQPGGDLAGDPSAKTGRIQAARNEARLGDIRTILGGSVSDPREWKRALAIIDELFGELERYTEPTPPTGA